jgi:pyrroline-5-carboxylate reductase
MSKRVAFIGGGNMGRAIVGGLISRGHAPGAIIVAEPLEALRVALARDFGVNVTMDNAAAVAVADVVVLAVKPQQMKAVVQPLAGILTTRRPVLLSIAAGITTQSLGRWIGAEIPMVRAMPNTPALVGRGATGLFATPAATPADRALVESLLAATGMVAWVEEESLLDAVTALSGSGPAYFFLLLESLEQAGTRLGLPAELARRLAIETAAGAAELARTATVDPATLRSQVTSKGGTTERALQVFMEGGLPALVDGALVAAATRAQELSREFGDP